MKTRNIQRFLIFFASLALCATAVACASTQSAQTTQIAARPSPDTVPATPATPKIDDDIAPILQNITAATPDTPQPKIASGTNDDIVWVEGSAIFTGSLADVYADLVNPLVIGPVHMTKNITAGDLQTTPTRTTYVMHVKMRYILSIEFDLAAQVEPFCDENGTQIGWTYRSEKIAGSRFLSKVSTRLIIRDIGKNAFRVDFRSENVASVNKEAEARKHLETLFGYWSAESEKRIQSGNV